MAVLKRAAEKTISASGKRQRTSKRTDAFRPSSIDYQPADGSSDHDLDDEDAEVLEDNRVIGQIQSQMLKFKSEAGKKNNWAKNFESAVRSQHSDLINKIDDAKAEIQEKRKAFKNSTLPVLIAAIFETNPDDSSQSEMHLPLVLSAPQETAAALKASEVLARSQVMITCYETLVETPPPPPTVPQMRTTFNKDKEETIRAFEAGKKVALNQLQASLEDKTGETRKRFDLDDDERHLARKVVSRGKGTTGGLPERSTCIGPLIHDFGKAVAKMQKLVE